MVLEKKLAGCVLEIKSESIFLWNNSIEKANEVLLIFKTLPEMSEQLKEFLKENHPYSIPFIAQVPIKINKEYLRWLEEINKN
ncbi:MAG: divalent cation tolerance protein CutA [Candidatus Aenigmarchaeota archaeon]|nr:divalent-cation tolerance protein CutA [Candidatus Aenigmarchaeota archaeon]MDW7986667.1 divalent cation tolerance protein CutA [Nitrososphaerota archaeon]MDW8149655.1 divalent cation tolerance protein CutA [Candidatus Aenigmarchaeota archaeon]